jgi:hypothetical protein
VKFSVISVIFVWNSFFLFIGKFLVWNSIFVYFSLKKVYDSIYPIINLNDEPGQKKSLINTLFLKFWAFSVIICHTHTFCHTLTCIFIVLNWP